AEAGSTVTVTWGAASKTATAGEDGAWSVSFAPADLPASDGPSTISVTATDAAGNVSEPSTREVTMAVGIPTIDAVTGDNIINAVEAADDVELSGSAPAGTELTVAWGAFSAVVTAGDDNTWSVNVPT